MWSKLFEESMNVPCYVFCNIHGDSLNMHSYFPKFPPLRDSGSQVPRQAAVR